MHKKILDDTLPESRTLVYQYGDEAMKSFVFSYSLAKEDSVSTLYTFDDGYVMEDVSINGYHGEFYESIGGMESHALIGLDENTNTVNTIIAYLPKHDIIEIANRMRIS